MSHLKIKYIENVNIDTLEAIKDFNSIICACGSKIVGVGKSRCYLLDNTIRFMYDDNGSVTTKSFYGIMTYSEILNSTRIDWGSVGGIQPIKIYYTNGTSEYGFRHSTLKPVTNRVGSVLKPLYIKDGEYDFGWHRVSPDGIHPISYAELKMLPYYTGHKSTNKYSATKAYDKVCCLIDRNELISSDNIKYGEIDGIGSEKIAHKVTYRGENGFSSNGNFISKPFPDWFVEDKRMKNSLLNPVFSCYTYIKSVYVDNVSPRVVNKVIPMSSLYMITRNNGGSSKGVEIWNNLDSTVKGESI